MFPSNTRRSLRVLMGMTSVVRCLPSTLVRLNALNRLIGGIDVAEPLLGYLLETWI